MGNEASCKERLLEGILASYGQTKVTVPDLEFCSSFAHQQIILNDSQQWPKQHKSISAHRNKTIKQDIQNDGKLSPHH